MDFPHYQYPWYASSRPRYGPVKSSPVQSSKSKVVSIPVHFAGSERSRSGSAIKIQKVIRGFLVRKNVKKIKAITEQVKEIERSVSKAETVDLIRNNSKERLKVNETLMSLLFKLDSVSGLDPCVKDLRKSVIKKAISIQELVDAVASSCAEVVGESQGVIETCDQTTQSENYDGTTDNACDQTTQPENYDGTTDDACDQTTQLENYDGTTDDACDQTTQPENYDGMTDNACGQTIQPGNYDGTADNTCDQTTHPENYDGTTDNACDQTTQPENYEETTVHELVEAIASGRAEAVGESQGTIENSDQTIQSENRDGTTNNACDQIIQSENYEETTNHDDAVEAEAKEMKLERMIEDNEKMMKMMEMLVERNEMQTRLMSELTRRVEQLEKAFMCDKLRRKKRKNYDEKSQDCKKFGGKR